MTDEIREYWDGQAADFDREADHGLLDPAVRRAWAELLLPLIPLPGSDVADLGCGTGSLSMLLAEAGHRVRGLDLSARMVEAARVKAARRPMLPKPPARRFRQRLSSCRVMPRSRRIRRRVATSFWPAICCGRCRIRTPHLAGGRGSCAGRAMVLVEGLWGAGAGIPSAECRELVLRHRHQADVVPLTDPALWGKEISDDRYLILSRS